MWETTRTAASRHRGLRVGDGVVQRALRNLEALEEGTDPGDQYEATRLPQTLT